MWWVIGILAAMGIYLVMSVLDEPKPESAEQRLRRLVAQRGAAQLVTTGLPGNPLNPDPEAERTTARQSAREMVVGLVEKATSGRRVEGRLAGRLARAGWRWKPAEFLVAQGLAAGAGIALGLLTQPMLGWLFAGVGWFTPSLLLTRAEAKRLKTFEQQLPDALAIVANGLRSGYSLLQALDVVSREMPDPISKEFGLVLREARVNIPLEQALATLTERVTSADLDLMVTAVLIQRQVGGNMAEVIDRIGETIKERIRMQGEVRTLTTQGRFSGWIVALLPVALVVMFQLVSPSFMQPMFHHPLGWAMLAGGALMQITGIAIIRNMVNMEV